MQEKSSGKISYAQHAKSSAVTVAFFVALGFIWEAAVVGFEVEPYLLPKLSDIIREMWTSHRLLLSEALVTTREVVWGFAYATVFGVLAAAAVFFLPFARNTLYPLMVGLQSMPKVALAPVIVVWFGYGLSSKVVMAFLFAFFPIVIATLGGLNATPNHLVEHFRALRASRWTTFWKLRAPTALPGFIDGCKVAMPLAVIGAVVGEFIGADKGLGNLIVVATGAADTTLTFAGIFMVTLLSVVLFLLVEIVGRFVWWRSL